MDADAVGVHIVFEKYWQQVRSRALGDLHGLRLVAGALHRIVYWALIRTLEARIYADPSTVVWAISRQDAAVLSRLRARSVPVVPHGVDAVTFSPTKRKALREAARSQLDITSEIVVLVIGNDELNKGLDTALSSLRMWPESTVLAVAGGMDHRSLERSVRRYGVEDRVVIWPHVTDVRPYYAASDVVIVPSREDAFAMPALEGLASGMPVVVSARAGVSELLEDERHALVLQDPGDPAELARHVRRIIADPDLARRLSHEGRQLAENCSWDRNGADTAHLIEQAARSKRFLVLSPAPGEVGGIERASRNLLRALAETFGPEHVGLLPVWDVGDNVLHGHVLHGGRSRREERVGLLHKVRYLLAAMVKARRWRRRLVIWCCHPHLGPVAWASAKVSGAPYAVWCHGREAWGSLSLSVRFALRNADAVLAPSEFTAKQVEAAAGLAVGRVRVIPHAVSPELPANVASQSSARSVSPTVLSVARLSRDETYKGVDRLIYAWPRVIGGFPGAKLTVVGDGSDLRRLEQMATLLGVGQYVSFLGLVSDVELQSLYQRATVFALPARCRLGAQPEGEGFGLVFAEAGLAGLPVVAGRAGPASEVVLDGETGILVDPEDPEEIAKAILELLLDRDRAGRLGERGAERVRSEFSYGHFRQGVRELVYSMVSKAGP